MDLQIVEMTMEGHMREFLTETNTKPQHLLKTSGNFLYLLDNVCVQFGDTRALTDINVTINQGEILFVTGKSGAGKTTLLNLLAGDVESTKGKLNSNLRHRFVAQVFQDLKLFDNRTVEENLWYAFDKSVYKSKNDFYHDLKELCAVMGIKDKLGTLIKNSNGGLKQKTAMIRALLARPAVLLADEPTAAMDKESAIKMFEVLNYYNSKRKLTVIWASHNRDLVREFPGKIIHLEKGKLVYSGHACFI